MPIVPTLCVGMPQWTLCVRCWDAERPGLHSHAERGNDQQSPVGAAEGCDLLILLSQKKALIQRSGLFHIQRLRRITGRWQP
ncbi:hypothetical protein C1893_14370 [Pseudomonas sp. MPR-ANC1]|nr:hypothetical protein C1893_14370 [Pseudomonas sp. MPR-ANC1]